MSTYKLHMRMTQIYCLAVSVRVDGRLIATMHFPSDAKSGDLSWYDEEMWDYDVPETSIHDIVSGLESGLHSQEFSRIYGEPHA